MSPTGRATPVYVEQGARRCFACSLEWPGWCRSGRDEAGALRTLADYAPRYAPVARAAGVAFPTAARLEVVERLPGTAATDFGVPQAIPALDGAPLTAAAARRLAALVEAAWAVLDDVARAAPASLRKGPRGGGRDRDAIVAHVVEAEVAYARRMGVARPRADPDDARSVGALRATMAATLAVARSGDPLRERGWPARYAARRVAWHVLDHAWEIEDRSAGDQPPSTATVPPLRQQTPASRSM